jgi:copper chaperone
MPIADQIYGSLLGSKILGGETMQTQTYHIPNISCGHCTMTIENELKELSGVRSVESDIAGKNVTVTFDDSLDVDKILDLLKEINYPAK